MHDHHHDHDEHSHDHEHAHDHAHETHDHNHSHSHDPKEDGNEETVRHGGESHHHDHDDQGGHAHTHDALGGHRRPRQQERRMLAMTMALTGVMMVIELVGGIITNSVSLLSDAIHMFTHFFAIAVSYIAIILALRKAPRDKTYKYWRMEILAALFNGVSLFPMVGYIFYLAWGRIRDPQEIMEIQMFLVAFSGLLINIVCAIFLHRSSREDINVRGAFLHMVADALSSVGVLLAGGVIMVTGWYPADPIAAVIIGVMILLWSFKLVRDSCRILLESVPSHLNLNEVEEAIKSVEGVKDLHDTHIWVITSRLYALTTHVILKEDIPVSAAMEIQQRIEHMLDERFDIIHSCLQVESCTQKCLQTA